jgi:hypothetical protein
MAWKIRERPPMPAREAGWLPERLLKAKSEAEAGLALPYRGIASAAGIAPGLFPIASSHASTGPVLAAARSYLESLTERERTLGMFEVTSNEWRQWSNIHPFLMRHGVRLELLDEPRRAKALNLVASALSEAGYATARDIMRTNETLREISGSDVEYGEWLYWLSIMGTPSATEPWGFQLDGHHLIVNCFVLGDQLVVTPLFMGAEPTLVPSGKYRGTRVFAKEEAQALDLAQALSDDQFARARLGVETPIEIFTAAYRDNVELNPEGIVFGDLRVDQQQRLLGLISSHVGRIRPEHAQVKMAEISDRLEETFFAWMGEKEDDSAFYYRIHSPVLLIEFDHLAGVAFDNDEPTRNHVHSVVRTPNGNDYGMDLLRQHYERDHASRPG